MSVYVRNLTIDTHVDFTENLELYQLGGQTTNITGYSLYSHMRKHPDSTKKTDFVVGITSAAFGEISLSLGSTITSELKPGRYVYDVQLTRPNGSRSIAVEGNILVRAGISKGCF